MPSSSSCTATNQATAIVSEFSKSNKIPIDDNGVAPNAVKIPAHRFYGASDGGGASGGDKSMPLQQRLMSKPKIEKAPAEQFSRESDSDQQQRYDCDSASMDDDSTATEMNRLTELLVGDEVLIEFDGGTFHLGIIKDRKIDSILTRFESGVEQWTPISKLKKLVINDDQAMCVVCKAYDAIVQVCTQCRRGFHKQCIKQSASKVVDDERSPPNWSCNMCLTSLAAADAVAKTDESTNSCYCGGNGDWFMQMLQCARCLHWFHAKCIKCLNFPLYFGDR